MKYFNYKPTALENKLLGQNTPGFKKSLDEIKQQMIKLNKDERKSTINKNKNDRLNFLSINFCKVNNQMNYNYQNA